MAFMNLNLHGMKVADAQAILDEAAARKNVSAPDLITEQINNLIRLIDLSPGAAEMIENALKKQRPVGQSVGNVKP